MTESSATRALAIETVAHYHEATKHRPKAYAPGPGFLDWDSQPNPFRRWPGAPVYRLPLSEGRGLRDYTALYGTADHACALNEQYLGLFLELAMGLSAWKRLGPERWALRNNPSSGNLHPTETYLLLLRQVSAQLAPGLYHYAPFEHALERRALLPAAQATASCDANPGIFGAIAFSSIIWREAWKYGPRAYRYCQLDLGHALGATRYAAATLGWRAQLDSVPGDRALAALLGLDRDADFGAAEPEHPEAVVLIGTASGPSPDWPEVASSLLDWRGGASTLSDQRVDWPEITRVLPAMVKPDYPGIPSWHSNLTSTAVLPADESGDAADLIRRRRSAQRMDRNAGTTLADFERTLRRALPRRSSPPFDIWPYAPAVHLVVFVHDVVGLEPGLYILVRDPAGLDALRAATTDRCFEWARVDQASLSLYRLMTPVDLRRLASGLSCHQGIAGDGAFAIAMLADLGGCMQIEGAWAWRRLHWEAGLIGQLLYLEAEASGLQGTGIGCFFDDEVHALLGLPRDPLSNWQVVYHFTVGRAREDTRLLSEPPYTHLDVSTGTVVDHD
ncbi:MAG: SagB/ThcOx family dehydrogenase [Sedimenticolaceae bacterium]